jgi:hypothetical protein
VGRAVLIIGAVVWGLAAAAAALIAAIGLDRLLALLPPLAIDADAVRGAIVANGIILALVAATHLVALVALDRRLRLAWTAGLLLCALGVAVTIGLMGSAFASAVAEPSMGLPLAVAGIVALAASFAYAGAVAWFVGEIRAGAPTRGGP